jgi:two-component system, cell cycle sensor histidine kinase and response regulator CckA
MSDGHGASPATDSSPGKAVAFVTRDGRVVSATQDFVATMCGDAARALTRLDQLPTAVAKALAAAIAVVLDGGPPAMDVALRADAAGEGWLAHVLATPAATGADATALVLVGRAPSAEQTSGVRRAEEALRDSEDCFRQIADNIKDVFFITDQSAFKLLYVNPAYDTVYGRSREELYDNLASIIESIHPDDRARVLEAFDRSIQDGHDTTYRIVRPDGSIVWAHDRGFSVRTAGGDVLTSGIVTDITEERRLREELVEAQKIESIGRLAGGIAHDFNNILTVVLACADLASSMLPEKSPVQEELASMREAGERAAGLTQQLLAFARRQVIEPSVVDLRELTRCMQGSFAKLVGDRITLDLRLAPQGGAEVLADRKQLEQVLQNLVANARDAMPAGGNLRVEVSRVPAGGSTELEDLPDGAYVRLAVHDEGEAIAPADHARIFEPFFASRGRSAGLGLAMSHGIVAQAGGRIFLRSDVDKGATFEVVLPCAPRASDVVIDAGERTSSRPPGQETILLVEDQAPVRRAAATILGNGGYRVLEASDGVDALRVAAEHPSAIHLLLSDVVMPRMGGVELADRLRAVRPSTKVLFTSGFTEGADLKLSANAAFLPKPYMMETLLGKVRAVLDG